jgi:hypothetical protein
MSSAVTSVIQWTSIPVLLTIAALSPYAGSYELGLKIGGCAFAFVLLDRALRARQCLWASGFVGMAIVASPLLLVDQIFLLLASACIASSLAAFFALRPQPVAVL